MNQRRVWQRLAQRRAKTIKVNATKSLPKLLPKLTLQPCRARNDEAEQIAKLEEEVEAGRIQFEWSQYDPIHFLTVLRRCERSWRNKPQGLQTPAILSVSQSRHPGPTGWPLPASACFSFFLQGRYETQIQEMESFMKQTWEDTRLERKRTVKSKSG